MFHFHFTFSLSSSVSFHFFENFLGPWRCGEGGMGEGVEGICVVLLGIYLLAVGSSD